MDQRFLRNEMLWGPKAQVRLSRAHVILFGLGGVGSYTAECLARSGVGELTLVDSDTVSVTNINRQLEALTSTVGCGTANPGHQPPGRPSPPLRPLRRLPPGGLLPGGLPV